MSRDPYVVFALPKLVSNQVELLKTTDAVEALVRTYEERNSKRWAKVWISFEDSGPITEELEEEATCTRLGAGPDRCDQDWGHVGACTPTPQGDAYRVRVAGWNSCAEAAASVPQEPSTELLATSYSEEEKRAQRDALRRSLLGGKA